MYTYFFNLVLKYFKFLYYKYLFIIQLDLIFLFPLILSTISIYKRIFRITYKLWYIFFIYRYFKLWKYLIKYNLYYFLMKYYNIYIIAFILLLKIKIIYFLKKKSIIKPIILGHRRFWFFSHIRPCHYILKLSNYYFYTTRRFLFRVNNDVILDFLYPKYNKYLDIFYSIFIIFYIMLIASWSNLSGFFFLFLLDTFRDNVFFNVIDWIHTDMCDPRIRVFL